MAFHTTLRSTAGTVVLGLEGDLDSTTAPAFRSSVEDAARIGPDRLVLDMTRLDYLSSAGLRGLVVARQQMREGIALIVAGANPAVTETIRLTGFDHSVTFSERVPE